MYPDEFPRRMPEADLAIALELIFLPFITCWEELAAAGFLTDGASLLGSALLLLGLPCTAFLTGAAGFDAALAGPGGALALARRGARLLALGYALNALRIAVPATAAVIAGGVDVRPVASALDIISGNPLTLCGLSLFFLAAAEKLKLKPHAVMASAIAALAAAPLVSRVNLGTGWLAELAGAVLCTGYARFSLIPWVILPASCYCAGKCVGALDVRERLKLYRAALPISIAALAAICVRLKAGGTHRTLAAEIAYGAGMDLPLAAICVFGCGAVLSLSAMLCLRTIERRPFIRRALSGLAGSFAVVFFMQSVIIGWIKLLLVFFAEHGENMIDTEQYLAASAAVLFVSLAAAASVKSRSRG